MRRRPAAVACLLLGLAGVAATGCSPSGVPTGPVGGPVTTESPSELEVLRDVFVAELAEVETSLARGADDGLLDRRLVLTVALAEIERRLARSDDRPTDRGELLRLAEQRIAAAKEARAERPPRRVITLSEIAIEGREPEDGPAEESKKREVAAGDRLDGLLEGLERDRKPVPQAAVVQDAGTSVPPAVQRALADQMGRVAPCLPPDESLRVTVRAQWFGEHLRGIALAAEPPLVPAVSACLVDVLEGMRLPSSEGAMRVIVFPLAAR